MAAVSVIRETEHFTMDEITLETLRASIRGAVILRDDPSFEAECTIYNAMIGKYPFMIVKCREVADVMAALKFARDHKMVVAVRGGDQNAAAPGACDDGLVIDLSLMKACTSITSCPDRTQSFSLK